MTSDVRVSDFGSSTIINLYAKWEANRIVKFSKGDLQYVNGSMDAFVASGNVTLAACRYSPDASKYSKPRLKYYESSLWT